jgi:hypothetical protein
MSGYVSQGIATERFGVTFRSKLEAVWAESLHENGFKWNYLDRSWCDFEVEIEGAAIHVEVKPIGASFLWQAVLRAWPNRNEWNVGQNGKRAMMVFCGEPHVVELWMVEAHSEIDRLGMITNLKNREQWFWIFDGAIMDTKTLNEFLFSRGIANGTPVSN